MEHKHKIRKSENLHILFWLIKDTSWMMEWETLGIAMIVPTVSIALYLVLKTFKENEFFINLAILCWILANSYWMCCEFFGHIELKNYAVIPFILGFICTTIFYWKEKATTNVKFCFYPQLPATNINKTKILQRLWTSKRHFEIMLKKRNR